MAPHVDRFLDDRTVAERVLEHVHSQSTDVGDETWREPVENYLSPGRFEAERRLLRSFPTPFCPSAALPDTGSYLARQRAGTHRHTGMSAYLGISVSASGARAARPGRAYT